MIGWACAALVSLINAAMLGLSLEALPPAALVAWTSMLAGGMGMAIGMSIEDYLKDRRRNAP